MSDQYGQGRWGTGSRPLETGPAQSAYDMGVQDRRNEELRREQQLRDVSLRRQREEQKRREEEYRRNPAGAAPKLVGTTNSEDDLEFDDYILLAAIGGFTYLMVYFWNSIAAQFSPTNAILSAIVNHGVWAVGASGIFLGWKFQNILLRFAKFILLLAVLFFGSAIAYGIYKGVTGAG